MSFGLSVRSAVYYEAGSPLMKVTYDFVRMRPNDLRSDPSPLASFYGGHRSRPTAAIENLEDYSCEPCKEQNLRRIRLALLHFQERQFNITTFVAFNK
jgi:hypothetical protein